MKTTEDKVLIQIEGLKKYFPIHKGFLGRRKEHVKAVDGVSFDIKRGETFGLVGESGCGKTTLGRTLVRLYEPTSGQVLYHGTDITKLPPKEFKHYKKLIQMVFQDPYASLNTRMSIKEIIKEPLKVHYDLSDKSMDERVIELLEMVGLNREHATRYPHEFSGGQRQRIGIARALAVQPEFIVCDEPTSALDVSVQAQIVNMLEDLQRDMGLTYLFIAHDLAMVQHISNRIGVMYLGTLVELSDSDMLFKNPKHPYTQALISSIPIADPNKSALIEREVLSGDVPSPMNLPEGCRFRTRCKYAFDKCKTYEPILIDVGCNHHVACHYVQDGHAK